MGVRPVDPPFALQMVKQFSHQARERLPRINTITCSCTMIYYWINGVILGYKRKEDYYGIFFREV
jgi:hypothetical protein